jgi:hypothetical protein
MITAQDIAAQFEESGERPQWQIEHMIDLMGPAWTANIAEQASREITAAGPLTLRTDGTTRTKAGVFFAVARRVAFEMMRKETLQRRDFYRTFCWRERKPREPKPAAPQRRPPKPKPKPVTQRPAFSANPRRKTLPAAEIYAVRRSAR